MGPATGIACTPSDSDKPMVVPLDSDSGLVLVAVDPQGRIAEMAAGSSVASAVASGKVAMLKPPPTVEIVTVQDFDGTTLLEFSLGAVYELGEQAERAKDREPHH